MQISIRDPQKLLTPETNELAERRLLFALSRFDSRIDRVSLLVCDTNGPRGGIDKESTVTVKLLRLPEVRVTSKDASVEASIAYVAERVGRAVGRTIQRSQQFDRYRAPIVSAIDRESSSLNSKDQRDGTF